MSHLKAINHEIYPQIYQQNSKEVEPKEKHFAIRLHP